MYKFKNSLIALISMFALIGIISAVTPLATQGQGNSGNGPPPKDVNVVNTPSVVVANTPNVSVTNTPNVNVANTPNVNIANTPNVNVVGAIALDSDNSAVRVSNPTSDPVLTRDVDRGVRELIQRNCTVSVLAGVTSGERVVYEVPAGKRLVIEFTGINQFLNSPDLAISTTVNGETVFHKLSGGSQMVRLYADPGTQVKTFASTGVPQQLDQAAVCSISGYLEDVP
ncbi:MAG: hypothetical protein ABR568_07755 [Pyrinomonadaceae bacterium]